MILTPYLWIYISIVVKFWSKLLKKNSRMIYTETKIFLILLKLLICQLFSNVWSNFWWNWLYSKSNLCKKAKQYFRMYILDQIHSTVLCNVHMQENFVFPDKIRELSVIFRTLLKDLLFPKKVLFCFPNMCCLTPYPSFSFGRVYS